MLKYLLNILLLITVLAPASFANFFDVAHVSSTGMSVQRKRMDIIAENLANVDTIRTEEGTPYRRKYIVVAPGKGLKDNKAVKGVEIQKIAKDPSPFKKIYEPANPYADANGFVDIPNINTVKEMIDMMSASRAFEANIQAFNASKTMANRALSIGK